jgi:hypothetical protein
MREALNSVPSTLVEGAALARLCSPNFISPSQSARLVLSPLYGKVRLFASLSREGLSGGEEMQPQSLVLLAGIVL